MAAILMAAAAAVGYGARSEVTRVLVAGCVGDVAAGEFFAWLVNLDLRPAEEYLANPMTTPLPRRQDQVMATLASVAAAALDRSQGPKILLSRYNAAWTVIGRINRVTPDVAIPASRILAENMPDEAANNLPPEAEHMLPILQEANIDFGRKV
jgi:hypothetical protein